MLLGHAVICGVMTMAAMLLPWFVAHGRHMPPLRALLVALVAASGAALLILIVVKGFGVVRLRLATSGVLVILLLFLYGVGPFFGLPAIQQTKRVIHLMDRSYSARPLAERLAALAPGDETVAVCCIIRDKVIPEKKHFFPRDIEYGLSYYRSHQVVNYTETGVPDEEHLLVAQITGTGGVELGTATVLEEYLDGRRYEQLFSWPERGLVVYMVGSK